MNLSELGEVRVPAVLTRPDGKQVTVQLRSLSEHEVWLIQQSLPTPEVPVDIERLDGKIQRVPKPDNPQYLKAVAERGRKFQYRLILASLVADVPGANDEEKAAALEKALGAWAVNQLQRHILRMTGIAEAEVTDAANSFQGN